MAGLRELITFLNKLEDNNIFYKLSKVRKEAIMVEATIPGQRWEIEFMEDGTVEVENLSAMETFIMLKSWSFCLKISVINQKFIELTEGEAYNPESRYVDIDNSSDMYELINDRKFSGKHIQMLFLIKYNQEVLVGYNGR